MAEEIIPNRNPFFAGPQKKPVQQPVQPKPVQPVQPRPMQPKISKPYEPGFFAKNKKLLIVLGIVGFLVVASVIIALTLGVFNMENGAKF